MYMLYDCVLHDVAYVLPDFDLYDTSHHITHHRTILCMFNSIVPYYDDQLLHEILIFNIVRHSNAS